MFAHKNFYFIISTIPTSDNAHSELRQNKRFSARGKQIMKVLPDAENRSIFGYFLAFFLPVCRPPVSTAQFTKLAQ